MGLQARRQHGRDARVVLPVDGVGSHRMDRCAEELAPLRGDNGETMRRWELCTSQVLGVDNIKVTVLFLPPRTTSVVQPLDQGVYTPGRRLLASADLDGRFVPTLNLLRKVLICSPNARSVSYFLPCNSSADMKKERMHH